MTPEREWTEEVGQVRIRGIGNDGSVHAMSEGITDQGSIGFVGAIRPTLLALGIRTL